MTSILRTWPAIFVAMLFVVLTPVDGRTHATMKMDSPTDGTVLDQAPTSLTLSFTEPVDASAVTVQVTGQRRQKRVPTTVEALDGEFRVRALLSETLPKDSYIVTVDTIGLDGHPVHGAFSFAVGSGTPLIAPNGAVVDNGEGTPWATTLARTSTKVMGVILVPLLFVPLLMLRCWPTGLGRSATVRFGRLAGMLITLATLLEISVYGPAALGQGLDAALSLHSWQVTLALPAGKLMVVRLFAAWVLVAATLRMRQATIPGERASLGAEVAAIMAAGVMLFTHAGISHAAATPWAIGALLLMVAHVGAVSVWMAGVLMWLMYSRELLDSAGEATGTVPGLQLFSSIARWCVVTAVVTGVLLSVPLFLGDNPPLVLFMVKLVSAGLLLGAAARVHTVWGRRSGPPRREMTRELFLGAATLTLGALLSTAG